MPARKIGPPPEGTVPIGPKLLRRFYEPILFLCTLIEMIKGERGPEPADPRPDFSLSSEQAFHCYVYKLAQVCDNERGGTTVTSFAVLQEPGRILYVFGSNQRDTQPLEDVKVFVTSILTDLKGVVSTPGEHIAKLLKIRRDVLKFNKPRLDYYIECFARALGTCLDICADDDTGDNGSQSDDSSASIQATGDSPVPSSQGDNDDETRTISSPSSLRRILERLQDACSFIHAHDDDLSLEEYLNSCEQLLAHISRVDRSPMRHAIEERAKEGQMDRRECWHKLRHFAGRLLSTYGAADFLVDATRRWPRLFEEDFDVLAVESSQPAPQPFGRKGRTAHEMIGRMTSDMRAMAQHQERAHTLETIGLGEMLHRNCAGTGPRPIVHAEVLVADRVRAINGGTRPSAFFGGWPFIGSSKPTCRLCSYYFQWAHGGRLKVRPSHGNVYPAWRVPDLHTDQGPGAARERVKVMNGILQRVRDDVFTLLEERTPQKKRYDSETSSIVVRLPSVAADGLSDFSPSQMGGLSISGSRRLPEIRELEPAVEELESVHRDSGGRGVAAVTAVGSEDEDEGGWANLA